MGEILIPRRTKVEKGYELLADITVGTATTSVDITGLNIGKGDEVVLVADFYNPTGSDTHYRLFTNNNTTLTNYYSQSINADGTGVSGSRVNDTSIGYAYYYTSRYSFSTIRIRLANSGYFVAQSSGTYTYGSGGGVYLSDRYVTSTFTATSLTSLHIVSSATNAIGIGSRFQLYKIGGA